MSAHSTLMTGYFTLQKYIAGRTLTRMEKELGFETGRFARGVEIYSFTRLPEASEFEFRGYTHWPEGGTLGMRETAGRMDTDKLKKIVREEVWSVAGENRPIKVVPLTGGYVYPIGLGVPQWKLVSPVPVVLVKILRPGEVYQG